MKIIAIVQILCLFINVRLQPVALWPIMVLGNKIMIRARSAGFSFYCDFVMNAVGATFVINGWRALDCKHTCAVKKWRITSSFMFTWGHSESFFRLYEARFDGARWEAKGAAGWNGESRTGLCCPFPFFSCSLPCGLICYWLADWTPAPAFHLKG